MTTPTECTTPTPLDEPRPKVDPRVEVGRLFKQLKQLKLGKQDTQQQQPKPFPATPVTLAKKADKWAWQKPLYMQLGVGGPWVHETLSEGFLVAMCRDVMTELDVGGKLLKFCCDLPIVTSLVGGAAFAPSAEVSGKEEGAEGGDPGIAPFIRRWVCINEIPPPH